jgi:aryl-alcohol dehydrogenase-like predicted oxidoreductase
VRYRLLGSSGLRVSQAALGTMTFGEAWGWGASREQSRSIFDVYAESGGNLIDTAINYTDGEAESFVGEFVAHDRDHFVIGTKYSLSTRPADPNFGGNHRKNMVRSLEESLRRLGTDHVDILWLHMWDATTPIAEVMRAIDDLVRAGKVLHAGASDTPAWIVSSANTLADIRGWTRFSAIQVPYSLADRSVERAELPMAEATGLTTLTWGMLEGGALTGKYLAEASDEPRRYEGASERELELSREVVAVASETGCTPAQVALAWVRQQPWATIPILGARTVTQIREGLGALDVSLPDEVLTRLTDAAPIDLGFPRSFLGSDGVRGLIFGETEALLDRE